MKRVLVPLVVLAGVVPLLAQTAREAWTEGAGYRSVPLIVSASDRVGFTLLEAAETGLHFDNPLPPEQAAANNNLMNGSGVAAGDFDGDGWCDLYFCAITGTNALFRNRGDGRFENVTTRAGLALPGQHSTGALFADVNGDGRPDLLVATLGSGVRCFFNEGAGRFREVTTEAGLAAQTGSTSLAMADVDGDGDLDLYVANYGTVSILRSGGRAEMKLVNGQWVITGPYAKRLRFVDGRLEEVGEPDVLYLNNGAGRFTPVAWNTGQFLDEEGRPKPEPWDFGLSVQMRDINDDGYPDIYVCNDFQTVDRIWINDGTGCFRALPRLALRKQSFSSMGVDFADLDRDGHLDFLTTEMMSTEHHLRIRQVVGMQPLVPVPGRLENRPEVARNCLFHNRGDGTYAEIANFSGVPASDWAWQPIFLDVDLDGYEDLLIGNGILFDVQDRDVLDRVRALGKQPPEQARTNLLLYPHFFSPNRALRNRGDLTFQDVSRAWGFDSTLISQGFALADFDRDGDLDVAINGTGGSPLFYRCETAAPRIAVTLRGQPPNRNGIGARVRLLGGAVPSQMQEMLCGGHYLSGSDSRLVFAAGHLTNRMTLEVRWRSGRCSVARDLEANHLYEIDEPATPTAPAEATAQPKPQPLFRDVTDALNHGHHEELFNDFARQPLLTRLLSQLGPGVAWSDLDGDGQDELAVGSGKGGSMTILRRDPSGRFQPLTPSPQAPAADDVAGLALWFRSDGTPALLAAQANYETADTNAPAVIEWTLGGTNSAPTAKPLSPLPAGYSSPGALAVADLDGDGDLDLFVAGRVIPGAYPRAASSRVFRQQDGQLILDAANSRLLENVGLVSGAVWSDLDGNGLPELVLACEWGPVRIFRNDAGQLAPWDLPLVWDHTAPAGSSPSTLSQATGWWTGVTTGDFDEDGRPDIVVSNWGLNDACRASPDRPTRIYFGDLGGRGVVDLIEAYYPVELATEMPQRSLNALSQALPFLRGEFPTHAAFSTVTIPDILRLLPVQPEVASVKLLATTLFLNRGSNLVVRPLPTEAQMAPAFAANVGDADGDGHEDLFLSQNFFALRPEWPRLDGGRGLWLRGDGTGNLAALPGQTSGVTVYGEQRGAALGDFNADGRVDLAVTQNGAATKLYENVGARPGLRVRLAGPPGNPAGIGATVRLSSRAHRGPQREVHAGSGYWSCDSPVQVLALADEPTRIEVHWPGGKRVTNDLPSNAKEIVAREDGGLEVVR